MEWIHNIVEKVESLQFVYGLVAICGGVARYLNSYASGKQHFSMPIFLASAFVSGFSGWMFAILGTSMQFPESIVYIMAGTGGFFGDQTMKFIMEYLQGRVKSPDVI